MATKKDVQEDFLDFAQGEEVGGEVVFDRPDQADLQLRRIRRYENQKARVQALVSLEIKKLTEWQDERLNSIQNSIDWLSKPLEMYIRKIHADSGGKTKSIDLPQGKLQLREQPDQYEYDDPKIIVWIGDNTELAKSLLQVSVNHSYLKKHIKETGELPDGVTITAAGEPKFYIKFREEEKENAET